MNTYIYQTFSTGRDNENVTIMNVRYIEGLLQTSTGLQKFAIGYDYDFFQFREEITTLYLFIQIILRLYF